MKLISIFLFIFLGCKCFGMEEVVLLQDISCPEDCDVYRSDITVLSENEKNDMSDESYSCEDLMCNEEFEGFDVPKSSVPIIDDIPDNIINSVIFYLTFERGFSFYQILKGLYGYEKVLFDAYQFLVNSYPNLKRYQVHIECLKQRLIFGILRALPADSAICGGALARYEYEVSRSCGDV